MNDAFKAVAYETLGKMLTTASIATVAYCTVYGLSKFIGPIQVKM